MDEIQIYDMASSTWFNGTASGDVPTLRDQFCAGVSTSPDDSSFQIVVYSGFGPQHGWGNFQPLRDVYVLSLPSFVWVNVTHSILSLGDGAAGRSWPRCEVYNGVSRSRTAR